MTRGRKTLAIVIGIVITILLIVSMVSSVIFLIVTDEDHDNDREMETTIFPRDPYSIEHPYYLDSVNMTEEEEEQLFREAYQNHSDRNFEEAIYKWHILYRSTDDLATWGKVTYNLGVDYYCRERYDDAIYYFQEVLDSDVDDWEHGEDIMETNRDYHHRSCLFISSCHEMKGDFYTAREYMILSRDVYKPVSWCGTCLSMEYSYIEREIERLESLIEMLEEGVFLSHLEYNIEINTRTDHNYTVFFPVPTYVNEEGSDIVSFGMDDIIVTEGSPDIDLIRTERGPALNISSNESCSISVNITLENGTGVEQSDIFDSLSMPVKGSPGWYWFHIDMECGAEISTDFSGSWFCLRPAYERCQWYDKSWWHEGYKYPSTWHEVNLFDY